jgi:glycosyltransferase involved in cell wall biosynthesis
MHILHVTPYYAPAYAFGGVVRAVEGLAQELSGRGHRVTVLTTDALTPTERYVGALDSDEQGVHVLRVRNALYALRRVNLSSPLAMRQAAARLLGDVDVVHLHEARTVENLLVAPPAAHHYVPLVLSPHGTLTYTTGRSQLKQLWDRWLSPSLMQRVSAVVGLNEDETADARQMWGSRGLSPYFTTIANGIDVEAFARLPDAGAFRRQWGLGDASVCLFMGRLHERKGVDVLARAFTAAAVPNTRLLIVGPDEGMLPTLRALAVTDPRIVLTGYLEGEARLQALATAAVFALPATGEGLSMAALEAMAAGLPLLLSPGCYLPQAEAAGAAVVVPPQEAPLTEALRALLMNAQRRAEMGRAAKILAAESFSWRRATWDWEQVYDRMING